MPRIFFLSIFFIFSYFNFAYANEKIVFIDINIIFQNSDAGKKLNLKIVEKKNKLKNEIKKFEQDIDNQKNEIISQKNVLSPEDYSQKVFKLEEDVKKINLEIKKKNQELSIFKSLIEKEFSDKLNDIIQEYSINNSIDIILKKEDLLMAKNELDITKDIMILFNQKIKNIEIN
jgi:Skp family chaperone for outer membrane proteins|tara:strand:- start:188 stop:709 length:522 start_codon:yes stop_codon:yes gene_type:complete